MNKKVLITIVIAVAVGVLFLVQPRTAESTAEETIVISVDGLLPETTIDELISEADIIVIGKVSKNLPSKWKAPNGVVPKNLTSRKIFDADLSIFTDSLISVDQRLKGKDNSAVVRVRAFKGEVDNVRFESLSEPTYNIGEDYLLFLDKDAGPTQIVDPGNYISTNAIFGVYKIIDGKAISVHDEWVLEELIAYIQKSLVSDMPLSILSPVPTESLTELPTETPAP